MVYVLLPKMTSVKTFAGPSRVDSFKQKKLYHSESFDELNLREYQIFKDLFSVFSFFRLSYSWDGKKRLWSFQSGYI